MSDILLLVDYDNIEEAARDPRALASNVLAALPDASTVNTITLRIYGGWFEEYTATAARYDASAFLQEHCPTVIGLNDSVVRLRYHFADDLAASADPGSTDLVPITHTVSVRNTQGSIASNGSRAVSCTHPDCGLSAVRRWYRKRRACTAEGCPHPFHAFFSRREQKQVDTHMTVDLLHFARHLPADAQLGIASDDVDVMPGLLAAALGAPTRRLLHIRSRSRSPIYSDRRLCLLGVRLVYL